MGVNGINELQDLRDRCVQLEIDNRELTKHLRMIIEQNGEQEQVESYKSTIKVLENKITSLSRENLDLIKKMT